MTDPRSTMQARLEARLDAVKRHDRRDLHVANARVAAFLALIVVGGLAWADHCSPAWMLLPALIFAALVVHHETVIQARLRAERAVAWCRRALARLDGSWVGHGDPGTRFADPEHAYSADLDLFGAGGLYELVCEARTVPGQETLAAWLLAPAPLDVLRARQQAVTELGPRLDWREELAVVADEVAAELGRERLGTWATAPALSSLRWLQPVAIVLSVISLVTLAGWTFAAFGPYPFLVVAGPLWITARLSRKQVSAITDAVSDRARELDLLARILGVIERERFTSPHLEALRARLATTGRTASDEIAGLGRLVGYLDQSRNQLLIPLAAATLTPLHIAFAIERWRRRVGQQIPAWLHALGEIEALASLGGHAWLHPADPFPEITEGEPIFAAAGLGHPLLDEASCVRNDVSIGGALRVLLVSGSNMSGKSTLLRSVGVNLVLAMAGGPVRARSLRLSPLRLGSTLRIQDSLQKGASRFYAEITRLRDIVARAGTPGEPPLLFLLDELLHGTNSHDRRLGAAGILRGLVDRGAIGLCTTHDLALAAIVDALGERAANVHFEDHLDGDRIAFDYKLRTGLVTRSNAMALMRAVGLPVDDG